MIKVTHYVPEWADQAGPSAGQTSNVETPSELLALEYMQAWAAERDFRQFSACSDRIFAELGRDEARRHYIVATTDRHASWLPAFDARTAGKRCE